MDAMAYSVKLQPDDDTCYESVMIMMALKQKRMYDVVTKTSWLSSTLKA